jgi:hypothetical protein
MLINFLRAKKDIFVWKPSYMPGIQREVSEHALKIWLVSRPVKQHLRRFNKENRRAKVRKLQDFWRLDSSRKCITPSG